MTAIKEIFKAKGTPQETFDFWTADRMATTPAVPLPIARFGQLPDELSEAPEAVDAGITADDVDYEDIDPGGTPQDYDQDLGGQPERVQRPRNLPWRCIGRLDVAWDNGDTGSSTGMVIGARTVLTAAHNLTPPEANAYLSSVSFTPAVYWNTRTLRETMPFGQWAAIDAKIQTKYLQAIDYFNAVFDYAIITLADTYRVRTRGGTLADRNDTIRNVLSADGSGVGYLDIDTGFPPNAGNGTGSDNHRAVRLTSAGYPMEGGGTLEMYSQATRYFGLAVPQGNVWTADQYRDVWELVEPGALGQGALACQVIRNRLQKGASGAPFLRRGSDGGYRIVGVLSTLVSSRNESTLGTNPTSPEIPLVLSPTLSAGHFKDFLEDYQRGT